MAAIGQVLALNETRFTIAGIMPREFEFPQDVDLWVPLNASIPQAALHARNVGFLIAVGRLQSGFTREQARLELSGVVSRLARTFEGSSSRSNEQRGAVLTPIVAEIFGATRPTLWVLLGGMILILVIACANTAALVVARTLTRERELAVRLALGAGRWRVVRQLLAETLVLAVLGGAGGLICAPWLMQAFLALAPVDMPRLADALVNIRVALFASAVTGVSALLCSLASALHGLRVDPVRTLRASTGVSGLGVARLRGLLVIGEVSLAVVLLSGAALFVLSLNALRRLDLGYLPRGLLATEIPVSRQNVPELARRRAAVEEFVERIERLPGVRAAAAVAIRPLWGRVGYDWPFTREGQTAAEADRNHAASPDRKQHA